ncbi:MAG: hypothetical protein QNK05_04600 [Myxococcota bacterium]|nr:hypothetical protein [Myxococcota bacterium]
MSAQPSCPSDECRCHCGSLLARIVDGAVELKCRRCKRTHRVPIDTSFAEPLEAAAPPISLRRSAS